MKELYHYTKGIHLIKIVKDGYIKQATMYIDKWEKPAVHLTYSPIFEPTVWFHGDINQVGGRARIVVSDSLTLHTWERWKYVSGMSTITHDALTKTALKVGSPIDQWRCHVTKITRDKWLRIEIFDNASHQWVIWDNITPIEYFVAHKRNLDIPKAA